MKKPPLVDLYQSPLQLVVLWAGAAFIEGFLWPWFTAMIAPEVGPSEQRLGLTLLSILIVVPLAMLGVTWRWFGGHRDPEH